MKKIILFGAGKIGKEAMQLYGEKNIEAFCDNNSELHGTVISGKRVINANELAACHNKYRVVIAVGSNDGIQSVMVQLQSLNVPYSLYFEEKDNRSNGEIFADIYEKDQWGKWDEPFFSGPGSHAEEIINPYISLLVSLIKNNAIHTITDIGCGDFWIMREVLGKIQPHQMVYHGIDVVESLIQYNAERFGTESIKFLHMDVCNDEVALPNADLLIIRQVLQHLSNAMVEKVLKKFDRFKYVLVTEHLYDGDDVVYNLDKPTNKNNRLYEKSGVFLEQAPYNYRNLVHLLSVRANTGVIRTSLLIN